jgi:hypothetical protein
MWPPPWASSGSSRTPAATDIRSSSAAACGSVNICHGTGSRPGHASAPAGHPRRNRLDRFAWVAIRAPPRLLPMRTSPPAEAATRRTMSRPSPVERTSLTPRRTEWPGTVGFPTTDSRRWRWRCVSRWAGQRISAAARTGSSCGLYPAVEITLHLGHVRAAQPGSRAASGYAFRRLHWGTNLLPGRHHGLGAAARSTVMTALQFAPMAGGSTGASPLAANTELTQCHGVELLIVANEVFSARIGG